MNEVAALRAMWRLELIRMAERIAEMTRKFREQPAKEEPNAQR
jgi:aspartate/tyrosine/aromatic aminotransferase